MFFYPKIDQSNGLGDFVSKRKAVYHKYGGRCAYCGCHINFPNMSLDHIEPRRNGGSNDINNLNPSCKSCNSKKKHHSMERFRRTMSGFPSFNKNQSAWLLGQGFEFPTPDYKFYFETFDVTFRQVEELSEEALREIANSEMDPRHAHLDDLLEPVDINE